MALDGGRLAGLGALVIAAAVAIAPVPPAAVERLYSDRIYAAIQPPLTRVSNAIPISLLDLLLVAAALWWIGAALLDVMRRRDGPLALAGRIVWRTAVAAAIAYLAFIVIWGLNYRRVPLERKLRFDRSAVTSSAAVTLASTTVDRLNSLHDDAHRLGWRGTIGVDGRLAAAFASAQHALGAPWTAQPGRPKATLLDWYLRRAGVDGMTDPYFLETLVTRDLLAFERPFVVAHEWGHLAGYADEGEANFVGWLTCLRGDVPAQYSGWLFLYSEAFGAVSPGDRSRVTRLDPGPRADLRAIGERLRRDVSPRIAMAGWRAYDQYLKANRIEAGTASYARVVELVLGVRFGADWTPLAR